MPPASERDAGFAQVPPPPGAPDAAYEPPGPSERSGPGGRLHPAVMAIWPLGQVWPLLVLLVAGTLRGGVAGVLVVVAATVAVVRYLRFVWRIEDDALVIEQGLLQRQRRVIPLHRIQSVDLVRKLRHRLFDVVEVRVEAIGGGSTEGRLDALGSAQAEQLRAVLLRGRTDRGTAQASGRRPPDAAEETLVARLRPGRLAVAGLTGGRVGVAAALLGFAQQLFADRMDELLGRLPTQVGLTGLVWLVVAILVGAFMLSIAATTVAYWGFTLTRDDGALRIRRGLLEQRLETLPLRRVQAVRVEENLLRRMLGLAAVKVDVAGRTGGDDARETGVLLPLGSREQAFAVVDRVLGMPGLSAVRFAPMPGRARSRRLVRAGLAVAAATGLLVALTGPTGLLGVGLALPAVAAAIGAYRALGHGERTGVLAARAGLLVRRTAFVPVERLQSLELSASPLQRRRRLGTLDLQIARSPGTWSGPRMLDLDWQQAQRLLADLAVRISAPGASAAAGALATPARQRHPIWADPPG